MTVCCNFYWLYCCENMFFLVILHLSLGLTLKVLHYCESQWKALDSNITPPNNSEEAQPIIFFTSVLERPCPASLWEAWVSVRGPASLWEALPLCERPVLFCERPGLSLGGSASFWVAWSLCERPSLSVRGPAPQWDTWHFCERPNLSHPDTTCSTY